jgi:rhodanese-related sulfurtransferase
MKQIHASELSRWLSMPEEERPLVLDVREPWEVAIASLPQALHVPMQQIPRRIGELDTGRPVVCMCHHGMRSMQVAIFLQRHGIEAVYNLVGGIHAWAAEVDPTCPTY